MNISSAYVHVHVLLGLQRITRCTSIPWYFLPRYEYRILNKLLRYLRYIYIYCTSTNMGKHCLQLVLTPLPLMHGNFPNKLTRKIHGEQCLALYSRWRTPTHACFQCQLYRLLSPWARYKAIPFFFCCYVMYCIVTTVSYRIVLYRGKMCRCRLHFLLTLREKSTLCYLNLYKPRQDHVASKQ